MDVAPRLPVRNGPPRAMTPMRASVSAPGDLDSNRPRRGGGDVMGKPADDWGPSGQKPRPSGTSLDRPASPS